MIRIIRSALIRRLAAFVTLRFRWLAPIMVRYFDLVNYSQVARATDYLSHDYRDIFSLLTSEPITFVNMGAEGTSESFVYKYDENIERIFVEPSMNDIPITNNEGAIIIKKRLATKWELVNTTERKLMNFSVVKTHRAIR